MVFRRHYMNSSSSEDEGQIPFRNSKRRRNNFTTQSQQIADIHPISYQATVNPYDIQLILACQSFFDTPPELLRKRIALSLKFGSGQRVSKEIIKKYCENYIEGYSLPDYAWAKINQIYSGFPIDFFIIRSSGVDNFFEKYKDHICIFKDSFPYANLNDHFSLVDDILVFPHRYHDFELTLNCSYEALFALKENDCTPSTKELQKFMQQLDYSDISRALPTYLNFPNSSSPICEKLKKLEFLIMNCQNLSYINSKNESIIHILATKICRCILQEHSIHKLSSLTRFFSYMLELFDYKQVNLSLDVDGKKIDDIFMQFCSAKQRKEFLEIYYEISVSQNRIWALWAIDRSCFKILNKNLMREIILYL
ncbi:unnamed protein product [Blepharisma stoltei]|uniref:Uncharacterized protein n=1 Tax=Blepharisma stoltei TaxID=1481888 RepID=A0AAU9JK79_9CILI|nr:unnamed protein product [Blepharisma stoltei]